VKCPMCAKFRARHCTSAMYNLEKLSMKKHEIYALCKTTFAHVDSLKGKNEDIIDELTEKIKEKCDPIVKKYRFKYMQDL
jgi:hypothetical protein